MIRFIILVPLLIIFLTVSIPLQLIALLVGIVSPSARDKMSLGIVNWAFGVCLKLASVKTTFIGLENVPKDEPVLYIINHRSIFDILITYRQVPRPTGYIAKKEMKKYLTLTTWMMMLHCEFLDRTDLRQGLKVIKSSAAKIKRGISMAIFPEGTRNKTVEPTLEFHKGSFKIAEMGKCKIVPVVLNNTQTIFEDHLPALKPAHVVVEYLPPVDVPSMSREERKNLPETVRAMMTETYIKNKALV
ncbi:MAG: 1-acyl-sn-glycerol-3-phosphate acyltransferase [Firmicutes bacterium ADurb.Bin354]|nr:MAG: 1-acyl-sn-glycerol-3-phosphate acyltransferase [Firmicutes bacterium ADurb.Bin354]